MRYLLDLVYVLLLIVVTPWLIYQGLRKGKYRQGFAAKFLGAVPARAGEKPCIWLHAVSVGEVNLLIPLVAELKRRKPDYQCVVSTTTMTGYALAKSRFADLLVFYCPLDFSWAVARAMHRIRPNLLVLAELELWPNLVSAAKRNGAAVAIINGRLSEHSFRGYRRIRPLVAGVLRQVDLIAAQTPEYADRFLALGARDESVHVSGSIKFDGAQSDRQNPDTMRLRQLAGILETDVVFLAGSTQEPEEELALAAFRHWADKFPQLKLILVPRHPDRFARVAELLASSGLSWQRRTDLDTRGLNPQARILLVDKIGELRAWWGTATIGFVGGSFGPRGGQNMIEPAAYGAAVCFGPSTHNFRDVVAMFLAADAAVVVHDGADLTAFVGRTLSDHSFAADLGSRAQRVVASQLGATSRTVDLLDQIACRSQSGNRRAAA